MSDLHEIVDLGAFADNGIAVGAAVDSGAGADFHIVLDDDATDLHDLAVAGTPHDEAESVLAYVTAWMNDDAVADQTVRDRRVGPDRALAPDTHLGPDHRTSADHCVGSDLGEWSDHGSRIYGDAAFHAGGRMHQRSRCDPARLEQGRKSLGTWKQRACDLHKSAKGLSYTEHAHLLRRAGGITFHGQTRTGPARRQLRGIFGLVEKGEVIGRRTIDRCNARDAAV